MKALKQEPCEDVISRQAVEEIVNDIRDCISAEGYWAILERLKKLPSATQKPETVTEFADRCRECGKRYVKRQAGHWIEYDHGCGVKYYQCSICKGFDGDKKGGFCKWCGAKMDEMQESEDEG